MKVNYATRSHDWQRQRESESEESAKAIVASLVLDKWWPSSRGFVVSPDKAFLRAVMN